MTDNQKQQTTELQKANNKKEEIPAIFKNESYDMENDKLTSDDIELSKLKLLDKYIEGIGKPGEFIDSETNENFGNNLDIIVLNFFISWVKFNKELKLEKRSEDGVFWDDSTEMTPDENFRYKSMRCLVLIKGKTDLPLLLYFYGGSGFTGKNLRSYINRFSKMKNLPIYAMVYNLQSKYIKDRNFEYFVKEIQPKGYLQNAKEKDVVKQIYERMVNAKIKIEEEGQKDELKNAKEEIAMD